MVTQSGGDENGQQSIFEVGESRAGGDISWAGLLGGGVVGRTLFGRHLRLSVGEFRADLLAGALAPQNDGSHEKNEKDHAEESHTYGGHKIFLSFSDFHVFCGPG